MNDMKNVNRNRWFYLLETIIDIIIIDASYFLGFFIQRPDLFINGIPLNVIISILNITLLSLLLVISFKINKCGEKSYSITLFYVLISLPLLAVSAVLVDFLIKGVGIWRRTIFYAMLVQIPSFIVIKWFFYKTHLIFIKPRKSIIIEKNVEEASRMYLRIYTNKSRIYDVHYLLDENIPELYDYINAADHIIIGSTTKLKTILIEYCAVNNIDCSVVPNYREIILNSGKFNNIGDIMLFDMKVKLDLETRIIKRIIDIAISILAIAILSPLMLLIIFIIKTNDRGKAIYKQIRVTKNNHNFELYKFRTMIIDAEKESGAVLAKKNDDRITKVGRILRKFRLDEIPQFFNVLKGEMSIIGPRPERPSLINDTLSETPEFAYRTLVKAGLTGLAQTMGRYDTSFNDKLRFDLYYVNNYSLILDLKIIFYTFHTLFTPSVTSGLNNDVDIDDIMESIYERGFRKIKNCECLESIQTK